MKKAWIVLLCCNIICSHLLIGCILSSFTEERNQSVDIEDTLLGDIIKDMNYLTSDECDGRRPGTPGNRKAGSYIAKRFNKIGLEPFSDNYLIPYQKETESLNQDTIRLEIRNGKKTLKKFKYGTDFLEQYLDDADLDLPLVTEPKEEECAVLVDDLEKLGSLTGNKAVKLILMKKDQKRRNGHFYETDNVPTLAVFPGAYDALIEQVGNRIYFSVDVSAEDMTQENVVGIIPGKDRTRALVVSAHFDHVGSTGKPGDKDYTIWRGALDNASGVCTLLGTADELKEWYKYGQPPFDIVFAAFNSEEASIKGQSGSRYFIRELYNRYSPVFNINIDCLGNKDNQTLLVQSNDSAISKQFAQELLDGLKSRGIDVTIDEVGFMSDHSFFNDALCISTMQGTSNIHLPEDTADKLDLEYISIVSRKLAAYIKDWVETLDTEWGAKGKKDQKNGREAVSGSGATTESEMELLTVEQFEQNFGCRLDFLKDSNFRISTSPRLQIPDGLIPQTSEEEIARNKNTKLSVLGTLTLHTDKKPGTYITLFPFQKNNAEDTWLYRTTMESNNLDVKLSTFQIERDNQLYHVYLKSANGREGAVITTQYEDNEVILFVSVSSPELDKMTKKEQFEEYLNDNIEDMALSGWFKLIQDNW